MLEEFKKFALKGNMLGLAVGVIIGTAFSGLINSIVNDMFMPVLGVLTGGLDFSNVYWQLAGPHQQTLEAARKAGATLAYGHFITVLINFLIISFILFLLVKGLSKMNLSPDAAHAAKQPPTPTELLLKEIRELLKKKSGGGKSSAAAGKAAAKTRVKPRKKAPKR